MGASLGPPACLCLGSCVCSIYVYQNTRLGYVLIVRAVGFFFQGAACVIYKGGHSLIFWAVGVSLGPPASLFWGAASENMGISRY